MHPFWAYREYFGFCLKNDHSAWDITLSGRVLLAPMSGVTDFAFRKAVAKASRVSVVSEMVASEELVKARADVVRRAEGFGLSPLFFNWQVAIRTGCARARGWLVLPVLT